MIDIDKLRIEFYPTKILKTEAEPVVRIDDQIKAIGLKMISLCIEQQGLGLAANQIGLPLRMFVGPCPPMRAASLELKLDTRLEVFINPRIIEKSEEIASKQEGCLSLPGIEGIVNRSRYVTMEATLLGGQAVRLEGSNMMARIWQHEIDHLDGINITDSMTKKSRRKNRAKIRALEPEPQRVKYLTKAFL